jgi:atypical dual specificity phosphatase
MSTWFRTYGFAEIVDHLLIGAFPRDAADVEMLAWLKIDRVLNLVADREYAPEEREEVSAAYAEAGIEEQRIEFVDFGHLPGEEVEAAVRIVLGWLAEGHHIYLHCRAGRQRSAAIAAGVVAIREQIDLRDALRFVHAQKPSADPLPHQRRDLREWWEDRQAASHQP